VEMNSEDLRLFNELVKAADKFDGHLTICKFTTNWAISFQTPNQRSDIYRMIHDKTFSSAAYMALDWAANQPDNMRDTTPLGRVKSGSGDTGTHDESKQR